MRVAFLNTRNDTLILLEKDYEEDIRVLVKAVDDLYNYLDLDMTKEVFLQHHENWRVFMSELDDTAKFGTSGTIEDVVRALMTT